MPSDRVDSSEHHSHLETVSEESPLLDALPDAVPDATPLPRLQISLLLMLQLAEPITTHTLFPFINQLVRELDVADGDPRKVSYYVGLIESIFFVTESITILQWGRLSDYIGRKPVLLIGVAGLCLSMLCFGLSRTFTALVVSRSIAGLLCGNAGVRKSMLGELTDASNRAQGASLMPIVWSFGATIGPFIGGTLAKPQERWPRLFRAPFWQKYPYFLPCATAAAFSGTVFLIALIYLRETAKRHTKWSTSVEASADSASPSAHDNDPAVPPTSLPVEDVPVPLRSLLSYPVVISIANYGLLAVFGSATEALQSVFYATPVEIGGLGLLPRTIGLCLSIFGFINGVLQALFFAKVVKKYGPRRVFLFGIATFIPVFCLFPTINLLARRSGLSTLVWACLVFQLTLCVAMDMAYSCMFMFITSAVPNNRSLGATYGIAQTSVAFARAVGPASSTSLFAFSIQHNLLGGYAVYLVFILLVFFALSVGRRLPAYGWVKTSLE